MKRVNVWKKEGGTLLEQIAFPDVLIRSLSLSLPLSVACSASNANSLAALSFNLCLSLAVAVVMLVAAVASCVYRRSTVPRYWFHALDKTHPCFIDPFSFKKHESAVSS